MSFCFSENLIFSILVVDHCSFVHYSVCGNGQFVIYIFYEERSHIDVRKEEEWKVLFKRDHRLFENGRC